VCGRAVVACAVTRAVDLALHARVLIINRGKNSSYSRTGSVDPTIGSAFARGRDVAGVSINRVNQIGSLLTEP
jgi:hypothetical protein